MSSPELGRRVKRVRDMIDAGRWDDAIERVDQRLVETPDEDDHQAYHDLLVDIATRAPHQRGWIEALVRRQLAFPGMTARTLDRIAHPGSSPSPAPADPEDLIAPAPKELEIEAPVVKVRVSDLVDDGSGRSSRLDPDPGKVEPDPGRKDAPPDPEPPARTGPEPAPPPSGGGTDTRSTYLIAREHHEALRFTDALRWYHLVPQGDANFLQARTMIRMLENEVLPQDVRGLLNGPVIQGRLNSGDEGRAREVRERLDKAEAILLEAGIPVPAEVAGWRMESDLVIENWEATHRAVIAMAEARFRDALNEFETCLRRDSSWKRAKDNIDKLRDAIRAERDLREQVTRLGPDIPELARALSNYRCHVLEFTTAPCREVGDLIDHSRHILKALFDDSILDVQKLLNLTVNAISLTNYISYTNNAQCLLDIIIDNVTLEDDHWSDAQELRRTVEKKLCRANDLSTWIHRHASGHVRKPELQSIASLGRYLRGLPEPLSGFPETREASRWLTEACLSQAASCLDASGDFLEGAVEHARLWIDFAEEIWSLSPTSIEAVQ